MKDEEIVSMFLARNENAVEEAAQRYGERLRTLSFRIVEDRQTAEECENDTYFRAWEAIPPHEPYTYLYAFLLPTTRHAVWNMRRL